MKALISALLVSCALAAPVCAFAQANAASTSSTSSTSSTNGPVTRAEVRADLVRVEQVGYRPAAADNSYPDDIQRAEAIVAQDQAKPGDGAVGGVALSGSSDSGSHATPRADTRSIYAGH
ncbi:DUF4148 domain-containing protein [Paraburkholderia sacchari]|uniref:DUF4148 domain-containing protein n=1 Tax=Paraburkholderia sacchari TaxID=159450 RepID=UPI000541E3B0|nr:DUF4148 domain-containing protein [Paraburkholderia sacchari]NLP62915.1 DUF4148 domain-containing protein [Paraburkholderia sacchari]